MGFWSKKESSETELTPEAQAAAAAQASRVNMNELVLQSIHEGVVFIGPEGNVHLANPTATQLLGRSYDEILNLNYDSVFDFFDKTVESLDLEVIKPYIAKLWWSIDSLSHHFRWKNTHVDQSPTRVEYFEDVDLSIVDYTEIPDWDNAESIYIPLFKESTEIIYR